MVTASITPAAHLPLFDGFPYLTIRVAPAVYHVTLLPEDASERTLVGIARAQWLANLLDVCLVIGSERALYINSAAGPDRWDDTPPRGGVLITGQLKPSAQLSDTLHLRVRRGRLNVRIQRDGYSLGDLTKGGRAASADEVARLAGTGPEGMPRGLECCSTCGEWHGTCLDPSPNFFCKVMTVHCRCANDNRCAACGQLLYERKLNANYYNPRDRQIWHVPGFCGLGHRCPDWEKAATDYREAVRLQPDDTPAWINLGVAYERQGQYVKAVAALKEAVRLDPDHPIAWYNLGHAHTNLKEQAPAVAAYREAVRLKPDLAEGWHNLGLVYGRQGDHRQAVLAFREAVRVRPNYPKAWNNLGFGYHSQGNYTDAVAAFGEALRLKPDSPETWFNLGNSYGEQGQTAQAVAAYCEAVRLNPDYSKAWTNLGIAYSDQGEQTQAISAYNEVVRLEPDSAENWFNLGTAYRKQGQTVEAVAAYREAVRLNPEYPPAWTNLGLVYAGQKDYAQAVSALDEALRLQPTDTEVLYWLGIVCALRGDQPGATEVHSRLEVLDPARADEFSRMVWKRNRT